MPTPAYNRSYLGDIEIGQASLFERVVENYPHVNIDQFITDYMKCRIRMMLDEGWPRYATNPSNELLDAFIRQENYTMPIDKCHMTPTMAYWAGMFYAKYQRYWNVPSAKLIDWLPSAKLGARYPGMRDKSMWLLVEKFPPSELPCYYEDA